MIKIADGHYKKTADMGDGGVKNLEKMPTSFMDGQMTLIQFLGL